VTSTDNYEEYIKKSKDFKRVKQDKDWCYKAFPSWTLMPWYYQWSIGFTEDSGKFCKEFGFNGSFTDAGNASYLAWINTWQLRFYMDHTAGKGDLYIKESSKLKAKEFGSQRPVLIDNTLGEKLKKVIKKNVQAVSGSPMRAAYALDDEISWGSFLKPCMWEITDRANYQAWLEEYYGKGKIPDRSKWVGYNDVRVKLDKWSLADFDAGALMDQWTFNDSWWLNFLGDLVEYCNSVDPQTPCGFVGGQSPNAFGGFDYAKLMRKIQFVEAYNNGSSQAVIRSLNPHNAIPSFTTFFYTTTPDAIWQAWYYLAHGNRGRIEWVDKWFDNKTPKPWLTEVAPHYKEIAEKIGPRVAQSEWVHDGVAIYYSHPSIQLSWILDSQCHNSTWPNRNGEFKYGTSHLVRKAWENMLRDEGIQYNFLDYASVVQEGIPSSYKVLILPAAFALSDVEARQIRKFCESGGTVIADFLPGCWDQHGVGRSKGGVLDDLFGVTHSPKMKTTDLFQGKDLWVEINQDEHFDDAGKDLQKFYTGKNTALTHETGYHIAVRDIAVDNSKSIGKGQAVLMNLSPQLYNLQRIKGQSESLKREIFMKHVKSAGCTSLARLEGRDAEFGYEISYWKKNGRTFLFLCQNPNVEGNEEGGGNSTGLKSDTVDVTIQFTMPVKSVKNERTDQELGDGKKFPMKWKQNEAIVLSFAAE
jgi:hypothetical protein